jgi:hypothetical protein
MLLCLVCNFAKAQTSVNGAVFVYTSRKPIYRVEVLNIKNKEQAITNFNGEFSIKASINDVLVFNMPGYKPDTVLLVHLNPLRRYLQLETNLLNTVTINDKLDIKKQYAQTFNKANAILLKQGRGLLFYPSSYFSREGKQARRFKRMLKQDVIENQIYKRFNFKTITAILPIKQPELDAFLVLYKPSIKFIKRADANDFKFYLIDAYNQFKDLPPEKRVLPSLKIQEID